MVLKDYLNENKNHLVYVTDKYHGKEAVTEYEKLKSNDKYSLLNILIKTGRKNQIRFMRYFKKSSNRRRIWNTGYFCIEYQLVFY